MDSLSYRTRRDELHDYFDRTAADVWRRLMSDAPVSRIRATVRAGRADMRAGLLSWLPDDLTGRRILDAGCGIGDVAFAAAARGAEVVAVDISGSLLAQGRKRLADWSGPGRVEFHEGDMCGHTQGRFDHVVAMDSLIHYRTADMVAALERLAELTDRSVLFTFAPRTPLLATMHLAGRLFPRSDRAPAIEPVAAGGLRRHLADSRSLQGWQAGRTRRVARGFYISQAMELARQ